MHMKNRQCGVLTIPVSLEGPLYLTGQVTCLSSIPFLRSRPKNPSPLMHPNLHMFMLGS
jgi:hypothetical protein